MSLLSKGLKKVQKNPVGKIALRGVRAFVPTAAVAQGLSKKGNVLKNVGKSLWQSQVDASALAGAAGAAYFGGPALASALGSAGGAVGSAGSALAKGAVGKALGGAGGMSGAGGWPSDLTDTGASGGGAMGPAGNALSGGRQLLRNLLSGGKPLTFKNALGGAGKQLAGLGGGGLAGGLKTAAGIGLSLDQLRAAKRRRELSDKMLGSSTNIAGELGARGRALIQGADTLRVPAESAYAKLLAAGQRPSVDPSRFADTLNPYRKRFGGMAA